MSYPPLRDQHSVALSVAISMHGLYITARHRAGGFGGYSWANKIVPADTNYAERKQDDTMRA